MSENVEFNYRITPSQLRKLVEAKIHSMDYFNKKCAFENIKLQKTILNLAEVYENVLEAFLAQENLISEMSTVLNSISQNFAIPIRFNNNSDSKNLKKLHEDSKKILLLLKNKFNKMPDSTNFKKEVIKSSNLFEKRKNCSQLFKFFLNNQPKSSEACNTSNVELNEPIVPKKKSKFHLDENPSFIPNDSLTNNSSISDSFSSLNLIQSENSCNNTLRNDEFTASNFDVTESNSSSDSISIKRINFIIQQVCSENGTTSTDEKNQNHIVELTDDGDQSLLFKKTSQNMIKKINDCDKVFVNNKEEPKDICLNDNRNDACTQFDSLTSSSEPIDDLSHSSKKAKLLDDIVIKCEECKIFTAANGRKYFARNAINFGSILHPLMLPQMPLSLCEKINLAPKITKLNIKMISQSFLSIVKICIEYEVKVPDQVNFLLSNINMGNLLWQTSESFNCRLDGRLTITLQFEDVMDNEVLIFTFLIGSDYSKSDFITPIALKIGNEVFRENLLVDLTQLSKQQVYRISQRLSTDLKNCVTLPAKKNADIEIIHLD